MERDASELVVYHRKSTGEMSTVKAIVGQTNAEEESGEGYVVRITVRDYTIRRTYLQNIKPERNDEIIFQDVVYVVGADSGESHVQESDGYGVAWRIHTKQDRNA